MIAWLAAAFIGLAASGPLVAQDTAGRFDYYVLALSWSPNWCAREGDARGADQCDPARDTGWLLHGLWPQHETGYPADCPTAEPNPTRRQSDAMADLMGSGGLAFYQWKKHGRCTGLSGQNYYRLTRTAWESVTRPMLLRQIDDTMRLPAEVIEAAFLEVNPQIEPDMLTITCRDGMIQEARICLTRSLEPRRCGSDIVRDCALNDALFHPVR